MSKKKNKEIKSEFGASIHNHPFHLIETLTGKTIARAKSPAHFQKVISEVDAHRFTIHDELEGWFSPATTIFNQDHKKTLLQ